MTGPERPLRLLAATATATGVALWVAPAAGAHTGGDLAGLTAGVLHPFLGPDHLLAMVAVGILAAVIGRGLSVPAAFVGAMVLGGALGLAGLPLPAGETAVAMSVVALGAAVAAGVALGAGWALGLVAVAGFVHGHAHGVEAPAAAHPLVYVGGFVAATVALHLVGWCAGSTLGRRPAWRTTVGTIVAGAGLGLVVALG
ncbi:MAG: HupE/UreJ family protein [Microthrixaceae bacterium]